jgi:hypothetical protein
MAMFVVSCIVVSIVNLHLSSSCPESAVSSPKPTKRQSAYDTTTSPTTNILAFIHRPFRYSSLRLDPLNHLVELCLHHYATDYHLAQGRM